MHEECFLGPAVHRGPVDSVRGRSFRNRGSPMTLTADPFRSGCAVPHLSGGCRADKRQTDVVAVARGRAYAG
jgi:hypothetical protein